MSRDTPVTDGQKPPDADTIAVILGTIGDTTWRMFVPSIGCTLLGVWADQHFGTSPWLMIAGIVLGFSGAFLLVKKQLSDIAVRKGAQK